MASDVVASVQPLSCVVASVGSFDLCARRVLRGEIYCMLVDLNGSRISYRKFSVAVDVVHLG